MQAQNQSGEAFTRGGTQTEGGGKGQARHGVRGIQFAINYFVPDGGPAQLTFQFHRQAVFCK